MSRIEIDYYFWLSSDWSFLGHGRFLALARRHHARVNFRPVRMRPLLDMTGGIVLTQRSAQRQAHRVAELLRWRDRLGFPINIAPAHFPVDNEQALRVVAGAILAGRDVGDLAEGYMRAVWIEERNIADRAVVLDVAARHGVTAAEAELWCQADEADRLLTQNTEAAAAAGAFGAPTYVAGGELFWGQDRLDFLAEHLAFLATAPR